jgi:VanZ family protein
MLRTHKHWLPVIIWMGFIFVMSTDLGSSEHTSRLIEPFLRWLNPEITPATVDLVHTLVRKGGHLTEYAVLALLVLRAMTISWRTRQTGKHWQAAGLALLVAAAYAATDEFHQSFVPGRTASVYDVLIDTSGACAALAAALLWKIFRSRPRAAQPAFETDSSVRRG